MAIYTEAIQLRKTEQVRDAYGDLINTYTSRDVITTTRSVTMRETYEAMARGLKPEKVFVLADFYDYGDEEYIIFNEAEYKVIRTYQKPENKELEIVCERLLNNAEVYYASP